MTAGLAITYGKFIFLITRVLTSLLVNEISNILYKQENFGSWFGVECSETVEFREFKPSGKEKGQWGE